MNFDPLLLVYVTPIILIWAGLAWRQRRRSLRALAVLEDNTQAGLTEPPSLHPVIDPARCLGCGSCVRACPEKSVLAIIDGKAILVEPTACVGHGACQTACPTDAITLVFGTETRGVDIPLLTPDFETSAPGIFIAGELGGMGLIRNAIEQGRQAIGAIARHLANVPKATGDVQDVVIIGCGPAGIAASLGAIEHKLSFTTIDQESFGGTVAHFPRGKLVMTAPATLPLVGKVCFGKIGKEELLAFWAEIIAKTGLEPQYGEQVMAVEREDGHFRVQTSKAAYRTRSVLLAIGRRGTPRTLGVPGEELDKVVYRLIDPEQYAGKHMLVVGGGDSALEAAGRLAEQPGTTVTLSYRGKAYSRARALNRERVRDLAASGRLTEELGSTVTHIDQGSVTIDCDGKLRILPNDGVIVCAGGVLPTPFLNSMGIAVETKFGTT